VDLIVNKIESAQAEVEAEKVHRVLLADKITSHHSISFSQQEAFQNYRLYLIIIDFLQIASNSVGVSRVKERTRSNFCYK